MIQIVFHYNRDTPYAVYKLAKLHWYWTETDYPSPQVSLRTAWCPSRIKISIMRCLQKKLQVSLFVAICAWNLLLALLAISHSSLPSSHTFIINIYIIFFMTLDMMTWPSTGHLMWEILAKCIIHHGKCLIWQNVPCCWWAVQFKDHQICNIRGNNTHQISNGGKSLQNNEWTGVETLNRQIPSTLVEKCRSSLVLLVNDLWPEVARTILWPGSGTNSFRYNIFSLKIPILKVTPL